MTQAQPEAEAIARAKEFDWWFIDKCSGLYKVMLDLSWGRRHRKALPYIRGPRVLEVSFGMGYLMSLYADQYETTGIDYNPRCVAAAQRRLEAKHTQAKLLEGDAHALPFADASFDTLINTDAFTLYQDPHQVMREFFRVLAPGGRLVLMEYDKPANGNPFGKFWVYWARHVMRMPYLDFNALLREAGFSVEDHNVGGFGVLHMFIAHKPN